MQEAVGQNGGRFVLIVTTPDQNLLQHRCDAVCPIQHAYLAANFLRRDPGGLRNPTRTVTDVATNDRSRGKRIDYNRAEGKMDGTIAD